VSGRREALQRMLRRACVELGVDWNAMPIEAREAAISAAEEAMVERTHSQDYMLMVSTKTAKDFVDIDS